MNYEEIKDMMAKQEVGIAREPIESSTAQPIAATANKNLELAHDLHRKSLAILQFLTGSAINDDKTSEPRCFNDAINMTSDLLKGTLENIYAVMQILGV